MPKLSELGKLTPGEFARTILPRKAVPQPGAAVSESNPVARNTKLPGVNLLPDEYPERVRAKDSLSRFALAFVLLAAITGIALVLGSLAGFLHQSQVVAAQEQQNALRGQISQLTPYKTYLDAVNGERTSLYNALNKDVDMPRLLSSIAGAANRYGVQFNSVSLTINGQASTVTGTATGNGGCVTDPFQAASSIGCVTLAGSAPNYSSASSFFSRLNGTEGFLNGALSTQSNGAGGVDAGGSGFNFQGSVAIDSGFYSNKFASLGVPIGADNVAGGGSQLATLAQQLKAQYPALQNASAAQIQGLATAICAASAQPTTAAALATTTVGLASQSGLQLTAADATSLNTRVISSQCAANSPNITGGTTGASTPASGSVTSSAPATNGTGN